MGLADDEQIRAKQLANLSPQNSVKHGVHRWLENGLAPPCYRCIIADCPVRDDDVDVCPIALERQAEIIAGLMDLDHIQPTDLPLVREYAKLVVACEIADAWLSRVGPWVLTDDGDVQPRSLMLTTRISLSRSIREYAKELGLTPAARSRLALNREARELTIADLLRQANEVSDDD